MCKLLKGHYEVFRILGGTHGQYVEQFGDLHKGDEGLKELEEFRHGYETVPSFTKEDVANAPKQAHFLKRKRSVAGVAGPGVAKNRRRFVRAPLPYALVA